MIRPIRPPPSPALSAQSNETRLSSKRPSSGASATTELQPKVTKNDEEQVALLQNMMSLLTSHTQTMQTFQNRMTAIEKAIAPQDETIEDLNESFESAPDSTVDDEWHAPSPASPQAVDHQPQEEDVLKNQIAEAQRKLAALRALPSTILPFGGKTGIL